MTARKILAQSALVAFALFALGVFGVSTTQAATTIRLRAGNGETGYTVNMFLPAAATVATGDTVHWDFPWKEPHTVTFGTPAGDPTAVPSPFPAAAVPYDGTGSITSGLIGTDFPNVPGAPRGPNAFEVRFTKAGTYDYFCAIHPNMQATITVVDTGTTSAQAALDIAGNADYSAALAALKTVAAGLAAKPVAVSSTAGGASQYTLAIGGETDKGGVQQYFPATANIKAGDSIVWKSDVHGPHTVTFGAPPPDDPFTAAPTKPAGGFDGSAGASSAVIGIDMPNGSTFQLTFTRAGTYTYLCILHFNQGMTGTVSVAAVAAAPTPTVAPTAVAPAPPSTGSGSREHDAGTAWLLVGMFALASAASLAGLAFARRR